MLIAEVKKDSAIMYNNQAWVVTKISFTNPGKGSAFYTVKMRNIKQGNLIETNIKSGENIEEANIERRKTQYLYAQGENYLFMDSENYDQFELTKETLKEKIHFILEGTEYYINYLDEEPYNLQLPPKVELTVTEAPEGDRGDTSGTALKEVTLETGYTVKTPLFIKTGDKIKVNTETGEYSEKVS